MSSPKYKRVLLKISGEVLGGKNGGLDYDAINSVATQVADAAKTGVDLALVVGGGNIIRGTEAQNFGVARTTADYMGMLATVINSLALQAVLEERYNLQTRVQSAIKVSSVAEDFIRRRAIRHLEKKRIVIFAAGTGNPYFSTDTAAVLRAIEIQADLMIKATKVDGVYDKDPKKYADAKRFESISFRNVLEKRLQVMDSTAIALCMDNNLPIMVLNIFEQGHIVDAIMGKPVGTLVHSGE
ncbi:UMP kinase [Thermospira aquatica]|uniref:Uridylate kinase n=1 Tax=Thermospira aquatica TaxID=2828656 RepID=A0AAX3BDC3_9SPIR|nr:UMP kinase [Thermospira aquatica]URA10200.1 UMP kinase [Thermospira aquatica]